MPSPAAAPPTAPATAPLSRAPEPLPDSLDGRAAPTGSVEPELSSEVEQNSWRARRFAASFELGWNSLAGAGLNLTWRPLAHLALDAGCGYGLHGLRFGGRVRVPLLPRRVTPYLGVGLAYDLGVSGRSAVVDTTSYETFSHVLSGFALQAVGGISLVSREGFFVMSSAGYAFALSGQSDLSPGLPDEVGGPVSKDFSGSGFALGLALGGAF